jgi:hypothetical protein
LREIGIKKICVNPLALSLRIIEEELGFVPLEFRYLKEFHIETERELSEDEMRTTPQHFVFPLYIDHVVDIIHPNFYEVFKFNPVDEPLLEMVFLNKANRMTEKSFGKNLWLPEPHVLLATKLNSVIGRDKQHKRLKDIADVFALLWFSDSEIAEIKSNLLEFYDREDIKRTIGSISKQEILNVASVTGFNREEVERILLEIAR